MALDTRFDLGGASTLAKGAATGLLQRGKARLQQVRSRWLIVAICAAVGVAIGAASVVLTSPQYAAEGTIRISYPDFAAKASDKNSSDDLARIVSYRQLRSYVSASDGPSIVEPVAEAVGLSPAEVKERVNVKADVSTSLLTVTALDTSPERASKMSVGTVEKLTAYVQKIEGPKNATVVPASKVHVSSSPVAPDPLNNIGLGLFLGFVAGLSGALLGQRPDPRITSVDQLAALTDAPILGSIEYDARLETYPLAPQLDAFQQLRTSLQFVGGTPRRLLVTSPAGSEGKTTIASNIALVLARTGRRVVLVECNLPTGLDTADLFGLPAQIGLMPVLTGRVDPEDALLPINGMPLEVIPIGAVPRGTSNAYDLVRSRPMGFLLRELDQRADVVIIDAPSLLADDVTRLLAEDCDGAVLVVRSGSTATQEVARSLAVLADTRLLGSVLNSAETASASPPAPAERPAERAVERAVEPRDERRPELRPELRPGPREPEYAAPRRPDYDDGYGYGRPPEYGGPPPDYAESRRPMPRPSSPLAPVQPPAPGPAPAQRPARGRRRADPPDRRSTTSHRGNRRSHGG